MFPRRLLRPLPLLWLCLALLALPLRGLAMASMVLPDAEAAMTAEHCHEGDGSPAGSGGGTPCASCDICHGGLLAPAPALPRAQAANPPRIAAVPTLPCRRPAARLERPPRG